MTRQFSEVLDDLLTKHITDFNIRNTGGMNDTNNIKLCNKEAKAAIIAAVRELGAEVIGRDFYDYTPEDLYSGEYDHENKVKAEQRSRLETLLGDGDERK